MKKIIFNLLVISFLTTTVFAQNKSIGVSSGVSLGHFYTGKDAITDPSITRFIANAFYENRFIDKRIIKRYNMFFNTYNNYIFIGKFKYNNFF